MTLPVLLSEQEAAEIVRASQKTLRKARQTGRLPFVKIGRTILYTESDLKTFIESARQCHSTAEKTPRIGNTTSQSMVLDFAAARAELQSAKRSSPKGS